MLTIIEIANELAYSFIWSKNKKDASIHIITEINSLIYPESNKPIDYSIKVEIIRLIQQYIVTELKDNSLFYYLKDHILQQLKTGKEKN